MTIASVIIITSKRNESYGRIAVVIGKSEQHYYAIDLEPILRSTRKYAPRPFYVVKKDAVKKIPLGKMDNSFRRKANHALSEGKRWLVSKKDKDQLETLPRSE
jgi:hypothetical protein